MSSNLEREKFAVTQIMIVIFQDFEEDFSKEVHIVHIQPAH